MAFGNIGKKIKSFFGPENRFFNGAAEDQYGTGYAPQPSVQPDQGWGYQQQAYQQNPGYQQPAYQQPAYQQPQNFGYQQPYQQQPQQNTGYQQPQQRPAEFQQQTVDQAYVLPNNRRNRRAKPQEQENIVPFPNAQQPAQNETPEQPEQPEQKVFRVCIVNVRNIQDCRSAISVLRTGDCVVAVIDSIADQAEVRRYVDMLNGACFSLGCSITRTSSRVGVYFLAPPETRVLTDQTTLQMNSQSRAPQRGRSGQMSFTARQAAPQQTAYQQQPFYQQPTYQQQQQSPYPQPPQQQNPYQGYTAVQQPAYQQQPQQQYTAQQPTQGYVPDQPAEGYAQQQQDAMM